MSGCTRSVQDAAIERLNVEDSQQNTSSVTGCFYRNDECQRFHTISFFVGPSIAIFVWPLHERICSIPARFFGRYTKATLSLAHSQSSCVPHHQTVHGALRNSAEKHDSTNAERTARPALNRCLYAMLQNYIMLQIYSKGAPPS